MRLVLVALAMPLVARAQQVKPEAGGGLIAAQIAGGTAALPIGFIGAGLLARQVARAAGADMETAATIARISATAGAAASTAATVTALGSQGAVSGNYSRALAGAVAGGLASYMLVKLPRWADGRDRCGAICRLSVAAIVLLPASGATIAFNPTRRE
jgi:hypothetical protein